MKSSATTTRESRTQNASQLRREQERQELRSLILRAAGDEFLEKGYDSFSLRRVAERIGYTPTTIYLHFKNKDDLLLTTVQEGFDAFDQRMQETAAAHVDPIERIEALGRGYIDFGLQNPALYRLMFMQRSDFYFMPRFVDENHEWEKGKDREIVAKVAGERPRTVAMSLLVAAVEEGMAAGIVKKGEPVVAADVLWAGAHGLVSLAISPLMSREHAQQVIDALLATLIGGVRVSGE